MSSWAVRAKCAHLLVPGQQKSRLRFSGLRVIRFSTLSNQSSSKMSSCGASRWVGVGPHTDDAWSHPLPQPRYPCGLSAQASPFAYF
jgi:hypothetical protein